MVQGDEYVAGVAALYGLLATMSSPPRSEQTSARTTLARARRSINATAPIVILGHASCGTWDAATTNTASQPGTSVQVVGRVRRTRRSDLTGTATTAS
jgi:hypothetical protein